jgi:UDP-N-acetylmuramoylalanine--D-glutamate ligase
MKKQIVILGAGESGVGTAILAKKVGYDVFVSDKSPIKPAFKDDLIKYGIEFEEGKHSMDKILGVREIIKSPGIPEKTELMQAIRAKGIQVIGEIEFGYRYAGKCTIVAITGSNGKTTTTHLTYHLLKHAGIDVQMGGNVGKSFAELVADALDTHPPAVYVLEVSSFQLDDIQKFRPNIAVLLNITPDHLDRYEHSMAYYAASKFRIAMNQKRGDLMITNADDEQVRTFLLDHPDWVKCKMDLVRKRDLKNGYVRIGQKLAFDVSGTALHGPHNRFNAACAIRIALRLGVEHHKIEEGLFYFKTPPHRMEKIGAVNQVTYINDSKATNVDSVYYALMSMDRPTVWIAGGVDKGNDYTPLLPLVRKHVKAIVCLGTDNHKITDAFKKLKKPIVETQSAEAAVLAAAQFAEPGDTVLLSPACASFDLFHNYEHRGDQFRTAVEKLNKTT